jgi:hypothetical protein
MMWFVTGSTPSWESSYYSLRKTIAVSGAIVAFAMQRRAIWSGGSTLALDEKSEPLIHSYARRGMEVTGHV